MERKPNAMHATGCIAVCDEGLVPYDIMLDGREVVREQDAYESSSIISYFV